jgi:parallel beta-helix repeat protein
LYNSGSGTATLVDCTVSGNTSQAAYGGGGIYNDGTIALTGSTVSNNTSSNNGGGLYINYGSATLTNCTISGNTSSGFGGGLEAFAATLTLDNTTIANNTSLYVGGFYCIFYSTATLNNTIVAGNSATVDPDIFGSTFSGSNNLIGVGTSTGLSNGVNGNITGVANPALGPLGNYGGPTQTVPLLPGSPAIDAGTSIGAPSTDQRGLARYGNVDIGSFESQGFNFSVVPGGTPQSAVIGTAFANPLAVTVTANNPIEPVNGGLVYFTAVPASNDASALFQTAPAVIANGSGSTLAAPNDVDGSYTVIASSTDFSATFNLTNTGTPIPAMVVNTLSDSASPGNGLLSLREAIDDDNNVAFPIPAAPITFDPTVFATAQTITLTNGVLELSDTSSPITITAPSAGVTINANATGRVFLVDTGVSASLTGLTITGGYLSGITYGGGIYDEGNLSLTDCTVSGNTAGFAGGGLFIAKSGTALLTGSTFSGNTATYSVTGYYGGTYTYGYGGGILNEGTATLTSCTITGNTAGSLGGGLENIGNITLSGTTVEYNSATRYGGGLVSLHNSATLTDCTIDDNTAYSAAGMYNGFDGSSTLTGCTISGNTASTGKAGGIYNGAASYLTLIDTTISGNTAATVGGGVTINGTGTLIDTTISGNTATGNGGAIYVNGSSTMTNTTVYGNTATNGGGIDFNYSASSTLTDCTISGNSATGGSGGGIYDANSTVSLTNSIVALNDGSSGAGDISLASGTSNVTGNHNLIGTGGSGGLVNGVNGNLVGVATPLLSPLGNYGGPTETIALLPGSPAIGSGVATSGITTDERGITIGSSPDIGAFYSEGFTITVVPGSTPQLAGTGNAFNVPLGVTVTPVDPLDPVVGGVISYTATTSGSGASATFNSPTGTIDSTGVAGVTATANGSLGTFTVTASVSGPTDSTATFTLTNVAPLFFTGIVSPQTVAEGSNVTFSGVLSSSTGSPVGETIAITVDGFTQDAIIASNGSFTTTFNTSDINASSAPYTVSYVYTSDGVNYGDASTTSLVTVTPVITFGAIPNQVYGVAPLTLSATASANLTVTYVVVSGPATVSGDVLSITGVGVVEIEAAAGNGAVGYAPPVYESFSVTPATLTIHPTSNQSKVYGAAVPKLTETVTGFVYKDNSTLLSGSIGTVATTTSGVGSYAFTVGTLSAGPNYVLVVAALPTFAVTPATLIVTPAAGQSMVYGSPVPLLTGTVSGYVNGDTSSLLTGSPGTVATSSSHVGTYAFTSGTLSAGPNYIFSVTASPTFAVTPATLTITPTAGQSKVYGSAVPALTGTPSGFVNGDTSALLTGSIATAATAASGVGTYAFTSGTLSAGPNYTIFVAASPTFAVTPATLTITPKAGQSKVYGTPTPILKEAATGFVNGDTSALLTGNLGTTATLTSGVGTYAYTIGMLTAGPNYSLVLSANSPTFTVTTATLTIDPTPGQSTPYGSPVPVLTYSTTGLVGSDTSSIIHGQLSTTAVSPGSISNYYPFTLGTLTAGPNYTLALEANAPSFVITRVTLTVTPKAGQSKVYGAPSPALTYTATGFVNGESASLLTGDIVSQATQSSPVGTYPISLGSLYASANYILTLAPNPPNFAVTPATLTIDPVAGQSKVYGAAVPPLKYTTSGLVNGDTSSILTGTITTTATATSPVGSYPFSLGSLNAGTNYTVALSPQSPSFTVTMNQAIAAPTVVNQNYSVRDYTTLSTTAAQGLLAGATVPDNLPLTAVLVSSPSHGQLTLAANGSFTYTPAANFSGTDTFTYKANDGNSSSQVATVSVLVKAPVLGDYFGTGQADLAIYVVGAGDFALQNPTTGADELIPFGIAGAGQTIPAPGDYNRDGLTNIAAYLPSLGAFAIRSTNGGPDQIIPFGIAGANQTIPAPGDYFGTGQTDIAAYIASQGVFAIRNPAGGPDEIIPFGLPGIGQSIPVPGDYDGSGKTELAVYMPSLGEFAYRPANGGPDVIERFGVVNDGSIPVPGDYDGSGKTEIAIYDPNTATFAYRPANGGPDVIEQFGIAGAGQTLPAPGDYAGTGRDELAAYLPATATFAIRPGNGQPDVSGLFGYAGLGQTIPITLVDEALADLGGTVSALSFSVPDPSTISDSLIFPDVTTTTVKKKHTSH